MGLATITPPPRPKVSQAIRNLLKTKQSIRIDLGCGDHKQPGADVIGIDVRPLPGVDIVHNLFEDYPWPLPDDSVRVAFMSHVWEHIPPFGNPPRTMQFMAELHRVMLHDGQVLIASPYGVDFRFVQDPTHCNPSNDATFYYWDRAHPLWHVYKPPCFHLESFEKIPVGGSVDFNAILRCCKAEDEEGCKHLTVEQILRPKKGKRRARKR